MSPSRKLFVELASVLILVVPSGAFAQIPGDSISRTTGPDSVRLMEDSLLTKSDTTLAVPDTSMAQKDTVVPPRDTLDIITSAENLNTIPGFRVQIGSTQNLSEAVTERAKAETLLSGYNVYIIDDSPYYKVRIGDFRVRYNAAQAANLISSRGFPEAWVVPDNVFKNPAERARAARQH